MVTRAFLKSAGLVVKEDEVGVDSLRLCEGVPERIRRFNKFVKSVFVADDKKPGLLSASLVALDGILPSALVRAQTGLTNVFRWQELVCLEWQETAPPRTERRALHARTQVQLKVEVGDGAVQPEGLDLVSGLSQYIDCVSDYAKFKKADRIVELERDALCWWYQCLPLPLFFHLTGIQPLACVSRACLGAEQTRLVIQPELAAGVDAEDVLPANESCSELLDAMAMSSGPDSNATLLNQCLDYLTSPEYELDSVAKRRWIGQLLQLQLRATQAGPITSLLIAWAIDLIESGTLRQPNPPKGTPQAYLKKALLPLFDGLRALDGNLEKLDVVFLDDMYRELVAAESDGSKKTMASALTNFHRFLQNWLDVPALKNSLHNEVPLAEVRAVVIWPHQIDLALQWVSPACNDPRLASAARVVLLIAREAPSRAAELAFQRICNVKECAGYLEIEVAPSMRYGRLKSPAAQRRLYVFDPASISEILTWVKSRRSAGVSDSALMFGDPIQPHVVYRRAAMSRLINVLLKAATGDRLAVGHSLRHTVLSVASEPDLLTSSIGDINRFGERAVGAGHVTAGTTLEAYTHLYERALRQRIDAALVLLVDLNSDQMGGAIGMKGPTLRQKACRIPTDTELFGWLLIRDMAADLNFPAASDAFKWTEPVPPKAADRLNPEFGASVTLLLLQHLAEGRSPSDVAGLFMLEPIDVEQLATIATEVVASHGRDTWIRKLGSRTLSAVDLAEGLQRIGVDLKEATQDKYADLYAFLQQPQPEELLHAAVESWSLCRNGEYLALDTPGAPLGLYRLIGAAGVNPVLLRICVRGVSLDAIDPVLRAALDRDFLTGFGLKRELTLAKPRQWVAQAYLQWDSEATKAKPHASSGSLGGLDALMFCTAVHLAWKKLTKEK